MEHKLILGGEQYLPFARSRIKALRATGLNYASQQFEVDGVSVKVMISGEHEYIRLIGADNALFMDSGIADIRAWNPANMESAGITGILYDTNKTAAYAVAFQPTSPVSAWKVNSDTGFAGKVAGLLTFKGKEFTGKIPYPGQPARSFQPGTKQNDDGTWSRLSTDPSIIGKKYIAQNCPPSVFTGKCRLYVQAMYGAATYEGSTADEIGRETLKVIPSTFSYSYASIAPMIKVAARNSKDAPVLLTTDSGVYLDPTDGTHWLFNPVSTVLEIYPLKSSPAGEKLRKLLTSANVAGLTDDEIEKIEAYVLMDCRPDVSAKVVASGTIQNANGAITGQPAMGYGWHWNWSGTRADIVVVKQYYQSTSGGRDYWGNTSSHYGISVTRNKAAGTWTVALQAFEENKQWSTSRGSFVITYPDWATGLLLKATPTYSQITVGDAPFYVFYRGDVLQVCRVAISYLASTPGESSSTTGWSRTYGLGGGNATVLSAGSACYQVIFSCPDATTGAMRTPYLRGGSYSAESEKIQIGDFPAYVYESVPVGNTYDIRSGDEWITVAGPGWLGRPVNANVRSVYTSDSIVRTDSGGGVAVIPPFDSEAIYLRAEATVSQTGTQTSRTQITGASIPWMTKALFHPTGGTATEYIGYYGYYGWYDSPSQPSRVTLSVINPAPTSTTSVTCNALICSAGLPSINTIDISAFTGVAEEDVVERDFRTITSASKTAVIPPSVIGDSTGCDASETINPTFVGWA